MKVEIEKFLRIILKQEADRFFDACEEEGHLTVEKTSSGHTNLVFTYLSGNREVYTIVLLQNRE